MKPKTRFVNISFYLSLAIIALLLTAHHSISQTQEQIVRDGVIMRSGPGNFYKIDMILNSHTPFVRIDSVSGWLKIKVADDNVGWISSNVLGGSKPVDQHKPDRVRDSGKNVHAVDGTALGAMIKGLKQDLDLEIMVDDPLAVDAGIDEISVQDFRAGMVSHSQPLSAIDYGIKMTPQYMAIAPVLATQQVKNWGGVAGSINTYANQILLWISECTATNSLAPRVFVCNEGQNAISFPGGWIVIGDGVFNYVSDEAEFAAVIAHEYAHAVLHHGRKSFENESWRIRSDDVFSELDSETDHVAGKGELELEHFAMEVLSDARRKWQINDELQADSCAIVWLSASGYTPEAMLTLLEKIREDFGSGWLGKGEIDLAWVNSREELGTRIDKVNKYLKMYKKQMRKGVRNEARFQRSALK